MSPRNISRTKRDRLFPGPGQKNESPQRHSVDHPNLSWCDYQSVDRHTPTSAPFYLLKTWTAQVYYRNLIEIAMSE